MSLARDRVPRLRWRIAGLIAAGVLINYFERISLSVAAPQLERSFQLTPADLGTAKPLPGPVSAGRTPADLSPG